MRLKLSRVKASAIASVMVLAAFSSTMAAAEQGGRDVLGFNPDINAPTNYDPLSPATAGPGGAYDSGGCHWTREQTYVAGKLTWRPLLQCYYGW